MNVYRSMVENKIIEQDDIIEKQKTEINDLNCKLHASEVKFREEISKIAQKYKQKQDLIKNEINDFIKQDLLKADLDRYDLDQSMDSISPKRISREKSINEINAKNPKQLKDEIKQRKQALREVARVQASSKIGLSKLVTSLEKQTIEGEKKIEILNHKLNQAAKEKQMFKQKYETLKHKVKNNETDDIKLIKTISLETREMYNKSPFLGGNKSRAEGDPSALTSLMQARKERKNKAPNTSRDFKSNIEAFERMKNNRTPTKFKSQFGTSLGPET